MAENTLDFVHRFVPAAEKQTATTLILLHGTGGDEDDLLSLGRTLAPGAALLGVRGKVSEDGALRFFRRLSTGVFDVPDLIFRTHELARFLETAAAEYELDRTRFVAVGYSNGANMAASLLLLEPSILAAAILFRAMVPLVPDVVPDLSNKSVLLQAGRHDPLIPASGSEQLAALLTQAGANVTVDWNDTGHGLVDAEIRRAQGWLGRIAP